MESKIRSFVVDGIVSRSEDSLQILMNIKHLFHGKRGEKKDTLAISKPKMRNLDNILFHIETHNVATLEAS